jgi:hypothetical protein
MGILSAIAMTSTFTSTSDSAPFLTALIHLHLATLDFRQIWKRSVKRKPGVYAKRYKKQENREIGETRTKRFESGLSLDEK